MKSKDVMYLFGFLRCCQRVYVKTNINGVSNFDIYVAKKKIKKINNFVAFLFIFYLLKIRCFNFSYQVKYIDVTKSLIKFVEFIH